jgi:hypothetical protein
MNRQIRKKTLRIKKRVSKKTKYTKRQRGGTLTPREKTELKSYLIGNFGYKDDNQLTDVLNRIYRLETEDDDDYDQISGQLEGIVLNSLEERRAELNKFLLDMT